LPFTLKSLGKTGCCFTALDLELPNSFPASSGTHSLFSFPATKPPQKDSLDSTAVTGRGSTITLAVFPPPLADAHIPRSSVSPNSTEIYF